MTKPTDTGKDRYEGQEVEDAVISEMPNESSNKNNDDEDTRSEDERVAAAQTIVPFNQSAPQASQSKSTVPTDDKKYVKFGIIFLVLTLGLFSVWAGFAPLSSALVSQGEVVVDSYRKSIQHFEGGIVEDIFVHNGDKVTAGQPLIQLETTQIEAQYNSSQKRLFTAKAELERLYAEQNFDTNLVFSEELLSHSEKDKDIANALIQQQQLLKARLSSFNQEKQAFQTQVTQTQEQIKGLNEQIDIQEQQVTLLEEEEIAFSTLFEEGLGDGQRSRELKRTILSAKNEIGRLRSNIAQLNLQITETELKIATRTQEYLKDVGERIKVTQNSYYDNQERLAIASDRVRRTTITAPENGIIVDLQIHTIGSVAPPGQTLLDLVPLTDSFVVEAKLMPQDINEVYIGQMADIRFSAFDARITKVIEGEVINVSADRLLNERDQMPYYLARIKVTKKGAKDMAESLAEGMGLKPGMPAEVMIRRGERTMFSYLLKPITDSFARSLKEK
ncbi:HlyD family type I secretion periplasmic adaptor subunit [Marinomonas sp. 15G1-11]|uniref:Membrane fusion protein (MFP) family protein n=1 Tax=Marinomonas phaeophyticola TaxID=3004091 RepID=A0ABT4JRL5_9GAMM|nr:HlyD family type I secretion periplasmic adaptor subunit [Marinomonas sp. 15G1-11]MCZ2720973.1 HlyD family type I secretion periplasmic adaptor subunit [Marinomonas sp. 15G1-11]